MAILIPNCIARNKSAGERELFTLLRNDTGTADWVVFHSLDVKKHLANVEGELDLLLVVPQHGVLCLEIKACDVSRSGGTWIYPYGTSIDGPFKQVSNTMHSLRKWLGDKDPAFKGVLFFSAVVFTEIDFHEESPEWHPWQVVNRVDLRRTSVSTIFGQIFDRAHKLIKDRASSWYRSERARPAEPISRKLVDAIRGDFSYSEAARATIERIEKAIENATTDQQIAIEQMAGNPRVLVEGPAGTGKTLLAIHAARSALSEGMRVGIFCYNRLLGQWLTRECSGLVSLALGTGTTFRSGSFHKFLKELDEDTSRSSLQDRWYWSHILPKQVADRIISDSIPPEFDFLVIDEAQDLMTKEFLDVMDLMLEGGLKSGRWAFFGDFERQAIYERTQASTRSEVIHEPSLGNYARLTLGTNCRNAKDVAETLAVVAGLKPGYRRLIHDAESGRVDTSFYSGLENQKSRLIEILKKLSRHFRPDEIVILSAIASEKSCAARLQHSGDSAFALYELSSLTDSGDPGITFTSIYRYKGLEASAVVLTDIENLSEEKAKALLYVGMSRARVQLTLLMKFDLQATYRKLILSNLKKIMSD